MYTEKDEFLKGYMDGNGITHKEFEYREMDGTDEEAISKPKVRQNGAVITRVLLERCITRIGNIEKSEVKPSEWEHIIQSLAMGDQDYAMLRIRELSLGNELPVTHKCSQCKQKINSVFTIDELPLTPYNGMEEVEFELPRGYTDSEGNLHKKGVLRHPIGLDREVLGKTITQNPSVANTILLVRCVKSLGNLNLTNDLFRKLSLKDRTHLFKLLRDMTFGYDIDNFEIECPNCGEDLVISFNQTDFL